MKHMKRIMALVLAMVVVFAMGITTFGAVNITINRDDGTYTEGGTSETGNRAYTYKQIFRATENANHTSTGGGYDSDGTPGTVSTTPEKGINYYLNATDTTQIGQLGTWDDSSKTWTKATGNEWFKLTKSADGSKYTVEWDNTNKDTDTVQLAARWLDSNYTALASDSLTASTDGKKWTAEDLPEGYYLLKGETGSNLIAATADITVNEKNSYPTVDKKQKDSQNGTYADAAVNVKVGDTIYYQVEVKVPANANADIVVNDTMSAGLTYDIATDPVVKVGETALTPDTSDAAADYKVDTKTAQSWKITLHPTANTIGKTVVITFAATVNNNSLVTIPRKNDVEITYGNYHQTDTVEHDTGAAAIIKYDGATADLNSSDNTLTKVAGVDAIKYLEATFTLTDANGNAVNVKEATAGTKGVYVVDTTATTNTVTSDKTHNGVILIYGLDPDVTYTLTETATENGYNLMSGTASITPTKAENATVNTIKVTVAEAEGIYAGDSSAAADNTLNLTAKQVSKIENNQGSVLPSTGGIGTTLFVVIGAVIVCGAVILLVARRRVNAEK